MPQTFLERRLRRGVKKKPEAFAILALFCSRSQLLNRRTLRQQRGEELEAFAIFAIFCFRSQFCSPAWGQAVPTPFQDAESYGSRTNPLLSTPAEYRPLRPSLSQKDPKKIEPLTKRHSTPSPLRPTCLLGGEQVKRGARGQAWGIRICHRWRPDRRLPLGEVRDSVERVPTKNHWLGRD